MLRLRTTVAWSALVVAGAVGMSLWMSAWPRMQDRTTEAAVAARQHAQGGAKKPPPVRAARQSRPPMEHAAIQPARAMPPSPPAPVYAPSPAYPIEALRQQRGGVVTLRVSVDGQGDVTEVGVARSSGDPALDASAQETMRQWRFQTPPNHRPMTFDYPVRFRIGSTAAQ